MFNFNNFIKTVYLTALKWSYKNFYVMLCILPLKKSTKKQYAFTLAEVLITLAVIGVLASITVPSMINSTKTAELRAGLKEGNAILAQAVKKMAQEEGGQLYKSYVGKDDAFYPVFIKYFNVQKDHGARGLVPTNTTSSPYYKVYSKKTGISTGLLNNGQFTLNNGMTIYIENFNNSDYVLISVDVNGLNKPPNAWGHDLFTFELMDDDSLKPAGAPNTGDKDKFFSGFDTEQDLYCNPTGDHIYNGIGCTAKALTDPNYWKNLPR